MKVNPATKNRKNQGSPESHRHRNVPIELREKGIYTQKELILSLLPYMEWVKFEHLRTVFWKYIDNHNDGPLRSKLSQLHKNGFIEKKYEGSPPARNEKISLSKYLYVRRVKKNSRAESLTDLSRCATAPVECALPN